MPICADKNNVTELSGIDFETIYHEQGDIFRRTAKGLITDIVQRFAVICTNVRLSKLVQYVIMQQGMGIDKSKVYLLYLNKGSETQQFYLV
jgi:hypothetical protein